MTREPLYVQLRGLLHHETNPYAQPQPEAPVASVLSTAIHDAEQGANWLTEHAQNLRDIEEKTLSNPVVQAVLENVVGALDPALEPVLVAVIKAFVGSNQAIAPMPAPPVEPEPVTTP